MVGEVMGESGVGAGGDGGSGTSSSTSLQCVMNHQMMGTNSAASASFTASSV